MRVWSSADDATSLTEQSSFDPVADETNDVEAVTATGSSTPSAISGHTWNGTHDEIFLLTSTDRTTWTAVVIDSAARTARTHESGADDGRGRCGRRRRRHRRARAARRSGDPVSCRSTDGFAAPGRVDSAAFTGRVLWLSADDLRWRWVPVPTGGSRDDVALQPIGGDLLVTAQGTGTAQPWTVPDLAAAVRTIDAGGGQR